MSGTAATGTIGAGSAIAAATRPAPEPASTMSAVACAATSTALPANGSKSGARQGQRPDPDDRASDDEGDAAGGGDAHPDAGERPRACGDRDAVETVKGRAGFGHGIRHHGEQPLGVAPADRLGPEHGRTAVDGDADGAGFEGRVDGEQVHGREHSIAGPGLRIPGPSRALEKNQSLARSE